MEGGETEELIRLSFFTEMARDIASASTLRETLDRVMAHIGKVFAPRTWSVLLHDHESDELEFAVVTGGEEAKTLKGHRISSDAGIAGWIFRNGEPLIVSDVASDSRFDSSVDELTGFTTHNIIGVPLLSRNRAFGVIELVNKLNGEPFTALDLKVLSTIADFAAVAIEKAYYLKALGKLASADDLTGVHNRRSLSIALDRELARCRRTGGALGALMIDIDDFKKINDEHGHAVGDDVLRHLARLLEENVREVDVVARYGGDEFIVLLPDVERPEAGKVGDRLAALLEAGDDSPPVDYRISIGVYSGRPDSARELFEGADIDLYSDKNRDDDTTIANMDEHINRFLTEEDEERNS